MTVEGRRKINVGRREEWNGKGGRQEEIEGRVRVSDCVYTYIGLENGD